MPSLKFTGTVVLIVGVLFLLRDIDLNIIGNISGWSLLIIIVGAMLLSMNNENKKTKKSYKK